MKPLKLEFEGINSFSEHTIIDLDRLTKNGIFGIFGDTGSGKSTILDSINFALYGNVERSREKTDIINHKCDSAKVKFVFNIINDGKRKIYTVERVIKRDKSGTHKATLYENDGEKEICIADKASQVEKKIVEILGVEAEDFRKCIALPQGEFAQFVKSAPRERLALIERLFSLSKYGDSLREKLSTRQNEAEISFQNLAGRMQAYDGVSSEALAEISARLAEKGERLKTLNGELTVVTAECERLKRLNDKRKELALTVEKLSLLDAKKEEIAELKTSLSLLSGCKEVVNCDELITKKQAALNGVKQDVVRLELKLSEKEKEIDGLEKTIKSNDFDEKIAECVRLSALYTANGGKVEKLKNLVAELDKKRNEYRVKDEELNKLNKEYSDLKSTLEKAQNDLAELADIDFSRVVNNEFKGALLRREYVDNLDYFIDLKDGIEIYKDDTPLYRFVKGEVGRKVEEYRERVILTKDFAIGNVEEQLEKYKNSLKERELRQKRVNDYSVKLQKLEAEIKLKQKELEISKKEGKNLRERADELERELEATFGNADTNFTAIINENEARLNSLKRLKQELTLKLENAVSSKNESLISVEKLKALSITGQEEIDNLKIKLNSLLQTCGCESVESCLNLTQRFKDVADAEKTVRDYEAQVGALTVRKTELELIDGVNSVSENQYEEAEGRRTRLLEDISALTGETAVLVSDRKTLETKLEEKRELQKEYEKAQKERELLSKLKEVTKGNKFLEYIANEYLCDISALASSTLLKLRDGRYFLTYKDNNFYVGDNFDCGNLRGVNTLSGGETFLVSLSLALALSQTICAKSMKSIEFFFLDEGFGTLDSALVDTVMNALEKLKSSAFTIGVISHVEELKYRIDSKITVNKATETHGSTISVSC